MKIKMYKNKTGNDFTFKVYRARKPILIGRSYPSKEACLSGIQQALISLRSNNMINIRSKEGGGGFLFSTKNVESCLFKTLDQASDGLAFLKETIDKKQDFYVSYDSVKEQMVSKKKIGQPSEGYDFKQSSKTKKPGFELIDKGNSNFYFHFNGADGKPMLFSRSYDGKTVRTKAVKKLITHIEENTLVSEILPAGTSFTFLLKTLEEEEIGRSKRFKSKELAFEGLRILKKTAVGNVKVLKLAKKKKKKKKKKSLPKEKYGFKEVAPIGTLGFEGFKSKKNKYHYFQFFDKKAKPLLYSVAFESRSKRDAAIKEAIELSEDKRLYAITEKKGNYHFILQTKKGKGLAKSRIFANKAELIEGMRYFHSNAKSYADVGNILTLPFSEQIPIDIEGKQKDQARSRPKKAGNYSAATKPAAAKESSPVKTESNSKNRKETPKENPPRQQQNKKTNSIKNTPVIPPAITAKEKQDQRQTPRTKQDQRARQDQGAKQDQKEKQAPREKQVPREKQTPRAKQDQREKQVPRAKQETPKSKQTPNKKQAPKESSNKQSSNQKATSESKSTRQTRSDNRNTNNRNTNNRNRKNPLMKEVPATKQSSTRVNQVKNTTVPKSKIQKEEPPRILPRGETEIPRLGFWKWLIPLILAILIGLWLLRSCGGALVGAGDAVSSTKPIIEKVAEPVVEKLPTLLGANAADLGFEKGIVAAKVADFLSLPESVFPATFVLDKVQFPTNQDQLDQRAYAQLDRMSLILNKYPTAVVQIKGHTDNVGAADQNVKLSQERATIVMDYLVGKGLETNRISAKGLGEVEPIQTNDTTTGRAANRRSEIVLIKR